MTRCGTITAIQNDKATVSFIRSEACGSCIAKDACGLNQTTPVSVQVILDNPYSYKIGQKVTLEISVQNAVKATLFAYVLPLILMLLCLSFCLFLKVNETLSASLTLLVVPLYYICLFIFRHKFKPQIKIKIQ